MLLSSSALLTRDDVRQLERLSLASVEALKTGVLGEREAAGRGAAGVGFADSRRYAAGDDVRRIDWHAYGRIRELLVNTVPSQTRYWMSILLDTSASMESGTSAEQRYGRRLTALLAAAALLHNDPVTLQVLNEAGATAGGRLEARTMLDVLADQAERLPSGRRTELDASMRRAVGGIEPAGAAILISDCLAPEHDVAAALSRLGRAARCATLFHVLEPADAAMGPLGAVQLRDCESGRVIRTVITEQTRRRYAEGYAAFLARTQHACRRSGVRYIPAVTDVDPLDLLAALAREGALLTHRSVA